MGVTENYRSLTKEQQVSLIALVISTSWPTTSAGADPESAEADAELVRLAEQAKAAFRRRVELPPAAADDTILGLAERAKSAFRQRMEPPPIRVTVVDIMVRDQTAIMRDYARESYDAAVGALLAEGRAGEVEAALRQLVDTGRTERADAIFSEMLERKAVAGEGGREAAAAARHGVALTELPAALAPVINPPGEARPLAPLGEKAEPGYARAGTGSGRSMDARCAGLADGGARGIRTRRGGRPARH